MVAENGSSDLKPFETGAETGIPGRMPAQQVYIKQQDGDHLMLELTEEELKTLEAKGADLVETKHGLLLDA